MRKIKGFQLTFGSLLPSYTRLICCFCHICKSQSRHFLSQQRTFSTLQEIWQELWSDTFRLETTFKHKGQVKTVMMTNTHWGAFSTFVNPFKVQGGCSLLSPDIWPPYSWVGVGGSCSILSHQSKWYCKDQLATKNKIGFHMALQQHYVAYLPRQRAGNCYQLPSRGPQSAKYAWWMKLLFVCQIPHRGFKIFNGSINIYVKRWGAGMRATFSCCLWHVVCITAKVCKNPNVAQGYLASLLEFPVGANVREDCLWRSGQERITSSWRESAYRIRWCLDRVAFTDRSIARSDWFCLGDFLLLFSPNYLKVEMMMILTILSKWVSYDRSKDNFNHFWKTLKMTSCTFVQLEECRHIFYPGWDSCLIRTILKGKF